MHTHTHTCMQHVYAYTHAHKHTHTHMHTRTQYGLYSAFMGCFIYVLFGTSKDITLGPTAILSLLTASITANCGPDEDQYDERITCALALTFLSGAIQFALGILNLGKETRMVVNKHLQRGSAFGWGRDLESTLIVFCSTIYMMVNVIFVAHFVSSRIFSGLHSTSCYQWVHFSSSYHYRCWTA